MNTSVFSGSYVRLAVFDPEKDADTHGKMEP